MMSYLNLGSALIYGALSLSGLAIYPFLAQWFPPLQDAAPFVAGLIAGTCMSEHARLGYVNAYEAWLKSPLIGHGPGKFSYLENSAKKEEAHNPGFGMLTQVEIAGVLLFAALYLWLLVKAFQARATNSLAVLIVLMLFSSGHLMPRQPIFGLYMIICALAVKNGSFTAARKKPQPT